MTERILLAHGSGGGLTNKLIRTLFLAELGNPVLAPLTDSAYLPCAGGLGFTTDSFVVKPLFFPGGDIGKLSVCGTVNDLIVCGVLPKYLSLAMIVEEGLEYAILKRIVRSIALSARKAGVCVATGDFKVVEKGACDQMFITTCGVGTIAVRLSLQDIREGNVVIITGPIAEHGLAVLSARQELGFAGAITSDCAALNGLLSPLVTKRSGIVFMRDPTRGGVSATLHEIAEATGLGITIEEKRIPLAEKTRAACELLGLDWLSVANEGKAVIVARRERSKRIVAQLRRHPLGRRAVAVGEVTRVLKGKVVMRTSVGTERLVDPPSGELLPRIC